MRTCLAIVGALLLIVLAGAGFAAWRFNQSYGYTMAEPISFETRIEENTRTQAVLNVDKLREYAVELLPKQIPQMPGWLPGDVHSLMEEFLPRELALLAGADYGDSVVDLTIFANERRIGPVIVEQLKASGALSDVTQVTWEPDIFRLEERGVITARGTMGLPLDAEQWVLENTGAKQGGTVASVSGDNLLEVVVDGHDGDLLALIGAMAHGQNQILAQALQDPTAATVATSVSQLYLDANLTGPDEVTANLRITLFDTAESGAKNMIGMGVNFLGFGGARGYLKDNYDIVLDFKDGNRGEWIDDQTFTATFTVTNFRPLIEEQIKLALGNAAATASS